MAGPVDPGRDLVDSPNVRAVREIYDAVEEEGVEAAIERMLSHAHADFEFRPYLAGGRVLRGADEVRTFFREQMAAGTALTLRPLCFEEAGDEVMVDGSVRLIRPTGGLAESQITWTFRFEAGLLREAHWGPRRGS